jgi:hypothetical protein
MSWIRNTDSYPSFHWLICLFFPSDPVRDWRAVDGGVPGSGRRINGRAEEEVVKISTSHNNSNSRCHHSSDNAPHFHSCLSPVCVCVQEKRVVELLTVFV